MPRQSCFDVDERRASRSLYGAHVRHQGAPVTESEQVLNDLISSVPWTVLQWKPLCGWEKLSTHDTEEAARAALVGATYREPRVAVSSDRQKVWHSEVASGQYLEIEGYYT